MSDPLQETEQLREATRLAHEVLRDLKEERKDIERLLTSWKGELEKVMQDYLHAELIDASDAVSKQIESVRKAVIAKFDHLYDTLMGQDKQSRRQGKPSIPELLQAQNTIKKFRNS